MLWAGRARRLELLDGRGGASCVRVLPADRTAEGCIRVLRLARGLEST